MDTRLGVFLDTSVLINFLVVNRLDLLAVDPNVHYLITDHVRDEITRDYPEQRAQLDDALAAGSIEGTEVRSAKELEVFANLILDGRLGVGECAVIAAASVRGLPLAIDDKKARQAALRVCPGIDLRDTVAVMLSLIRGGAISVADADRVKDDWRERRFECGFESFQDLIDELE